MSIVLCIELNDFNSADLLEEAKTHLKKIPLNFILSVIEVRTYVNVLIKTCLCSVDKSFLSTYFSDVFILTVQLYVTSIFSAVNFILIFQFFF